MSRAHCARGCKGPLLATSRRLSGLGKRSFDSAGSAEAAQGAKVRSVFLAFGGGPHQAVWVSWTAAGILLASWSILLTSLAFLSARCSFLRTCL